VDAAVRQVDATAGALGVLTPDGSRLDRLVVAGLTPEDRERISRLPAGQGSPGPRVAAPAPRRGDQDPRTPLLVVPVRVGDVVVGNLHLSGKRAGAAFTAADAELAHALAAVAGLAIENARLAERAEVRGRWRLAVTDMATALLSGADPDEMLRAVARQVAELASADMAGVLAHNGDDGDPAMTIVAAVGPSAGDYEGVRLPLTGTYLGAMYDAREPRLIDDISTMPVFIRRAALVGELMVTFGPGMVVPMGTAPGSGLLAVLRHTGRDPFRPDELDLLATFAAQVSVALELARGQRRERRLQVQGDRDRIARDLHDHVVQRIFATGLALDRISRSLAGTSPDVAARLNERVDELDGTIARIRSSIFQLQEAEDGSPVAVRRRIGEVIRSVTEEYGLQPVLRIQDAVEELPPELVNDVVAVVRELVTNVVRHAKASRLTVAIAVATEVAVTVTDDGCGLPPITVRSGLANLDDRAGRRGGRMTVSSDPSGTEVCWQVPRAAR
jgi:signal transduction histidine kinase